MDLAMLPRAQTRPLATLTACPDCGLPAEYGHQCRPRAAFEDQDGCGICGFWTCRCPKSRRLVAVGSIRRHAGRTPRLTATTAGITGSIRPAVTR